MVNLLVESLEGVANALRLQTFVAEHVLELLDHSVEDGRGDLRGVDVRGEGVLDVGVAHLERLVHHVVFI